jgi:hypothetical protein
MITTTDKLRVIRVNAMEFDQICGQDSSYLNYCGCQQFEIGDRVMIRQFSVNKDEFTGFEVSRYIIDITNRFALQSDDYSCRLRLSPFNPVSL